MKKISHTSIFVDKPKTKRKGIHSKNKSSKNKSSKNYKKLYKGQG
jgi:hypothetical protein